MIHATTRVASTTAKQTAAGGKGVHRERQRVSADAAGDTRDVARVHPSVAHGEKLAHGHHDTEARDRE